MKKMTAPIIASIALAITAQAGEEYSAKGGKEVVVPPPPSCLWTWFAGGSVGEVSGDWDEEIYTLHVGVERKCPGDKCTHAFFLEVGYTDKEEGFSAIIGDFPTEFKLECEIVPITLNYKYECQLSNKLNWYVGAGAGIALVDCEASITRVTGNGTLSSSASEDDTVFYAHIFAGLVYNVSESFEIFGGVRYIFMDDPEFSGGGTLADDFTMDEDIHYEIGGRFNF